MTDANKLGSARMSPSSGSVFVISRNGIAIAGLFCVFFVAFRFGLHLLVLDRLFSSNLHGFFAGFQADSDSLVIGTLEQNEIGGVFSGGISLGLGGSYTSQVGLGSWMLTLIPSFLGLSENTAIYLMFSCVAAFNAVLATAAVWLMRSALSPGAAALVAVALLQPWSVAIAHSIYWMIGLKLLPAAALLILFHWQRDSRLRVFIIAALTSLLAFLSGYEFLTVVAATQLAVVTYYSFRRNCPLKQAIPQIALTFGGIIAGFALALGLHFTQLLLRFGSPAVAIQKIENTVSKRTGALGLQVDPVYAESLASTPSQVLTTYLSMPVFAAPASIPMINTFTVTALLSGCFIIIMSGFHSNLSGIEIRRQQALGLSWIVALLGPIGWFLLARPHSYIHTHINFALWFLPTIPLGLALMLRPIRVGSYGLIRNRVALIVVTAAFVAFISFFIYSRTTMRS